MDNVFFVTGTDTDVGKTFFCAHLLKYLRSLGVDAGYQKWVSTGDAVSSEDLTYCCDTAGISSDPSLLDLQVPFRFQMPASPHLAAEQEGKRVDTKVVVDRCRELALRYERLIVEGVGGLLVPLTREILLADVLAELKLPIIVVARSGLGTLNHTFLTLEALRSREIPILGVVFSDAGNDEDEVLVADNSRTIAEMGRVTVFGRMKRCPEGGDASKEFIQIGEAIRSEMSRIRSRSV
ncbi:MAG: dethiobiotin synthase [Desulfobulbaceae bacterium]|nr:dethiobiotin synthase [Desulfobulbaceae bacterium]